MNSEDRTIFLLCLLLFLPACRHYYIVQPQFSDVRTIAVTIVDNKTSELRLTGYAKDQLTELLMLDGALSVVREKNNPDAIIHAKIISYDIQGIGEARINSNDDDQRKYRSTIFRVFVNMEYYVSNAGEELIAPTKVVGIAEYPELVDIDIVRKDGLRRAIFDACQRIVSTLTYSSASDR